MTKYLVHSLNMLFREAIKSSFGILERTSRSHAHFVLNGFQLSCASCQVRTNCHSHSNERRNKVTLCKVPTRETRPDHSSQTTCPTISNNCVGSLTFPGAYGLKFFIQELWFDIVLIANNLLAHLYPWFVKPLKKTKKNEGFVLVYGKYSIIKNAKCIKIR